MSKLTVLRPRVSEKAYDMSQNKGVYVFQVAANENKHTVKEAVEAQFEVTVTSVNVTNVKGKTLGRYQKRGRKITGKKPDIKKAYVTLKSGDEIAIFPKEEDKEPAPIEKPKSKKAKRSTN